MQYDIDAEFYRCIEDLIDTPEVQEMCHIPQHGSVSCFAHSVFVAYLSYRTCRKFGWDYRAAARGGLLHDLFLYDWREKTHDGMHAFSHPRAAAQNAARICELSECERDIILTHMWPVTPLAFYGYRESFVVSCVDKLCATAEAFRVFHRLRLGQRLGLAGRVSLQQKTPILES